MTRISAAEDTIIDIQPERWRLLANGDLQEHLILEASNGQPLRYASSFASRRHLPDELKPSHDVKQVVVGWSEGDQAWHLGLVLTPQLAEKRQSRWCEIARWTNAGYAADAERAGKSLAQALELPFKLIPPRATESQLLEQPDVTRALPALPLKLGLWSLEERGGVLEMVRARSWAISRLTRILWYSFWTVIYVVLSVATLTSKLALPNSGTMLPNPEILPYLGLAAAVVLIGVVLYTLYELLSQPGRIVIDPLRHTITAYRGESERWGFDAEQIESVYVSQVIGKKGRKRTVYYGELNLHLGDEEFYTVLQQEQEEERAANGDEEFPVKDNIWQLNANNVETRLQAAGVYIAQALGQVPAWYDQRQQ